MYIHNKHLDLCEVIWRAALWLEGVTVSGKHNEVCVKESEETNCHHKAIKAVCNFYYLAHFFLLVFHTAFICSFFALLYNSFSLPPFILIVSPSCSSLLSCNASADLLLCLIQSLIWAYKFPKAPWSLSPHNPYGIHESALEKKKMVVKELTGGVKVGGR